MIRPSGRPFSVTVTPSSAIRSTASAIESDGATSTRSGVALEACARPGVSATRTVSAESNGNPIRIRCMGEADRSGNWASWIVLLPTSALAIATATIAGTSSDRFPVISATISITANGA